jgi:hypothetical protein
LGINEQAYMKRLLRATARGAIGQANINSVELRALSIYKPPLQLQKKFGEKWEQIRSTVSYKVSQNNNLDHLFSVLMSRAFSSELTAKWREGAHAGVAGRDGAAGAVAEPAAAARSGAAP